MWAPRTVLPAPLGSSFPSHPSFPHIYAHISHDLVGPLCSSLCPSTLPSKSCKFGFPELQALSPPLSETTSISLPFPPVSRCSHGPSFVPFTVYCPVCESCAWYIPSGFLVIYSRKVSPMPVTPHWPESDVQTQKSVTFSEEVFALM